MPLSHQSMQQTLQEPQVLPGGTPLRILNVSKVFAGRDQTVEALRPVNLEDLLRREPVDFFSRRIAIGQTGGKCRR